MAMPSDAKEFCGKPPVVGLVGLYVTAAVGYALGGFGIGLLLAAAVGHLIGELDLTAIAVESGSSPAVLWFLAACSVSLCLSARASQWSIRAAKRISVQLDGCGMYVRHAWGEHVVKFQDIVELRVARPSPIGKPMHVIVRGRGRPLRLPQRLKDREDFVQELAQSVGLVKHHRKGRWEVYRRSEE